MSASERLPSAYRGRFAPSPTGALHQGSLISALASYLDARAHQGEWWVRIEDVDGPRCVAGADQDILATLAAYGMHCDAPPRWQSDYFNTYETALTQLDRAGRIYPCACTRRDIAEALAARSTDGAMQAHTRNTTLAYPGTCRNGLHGRVPRAWRLRVPDDDSARIIFTDRWQGTYEQDLAREVGDFALKRADGLWAYQLAVVVDDAAGGITDIVRGADLLDSTPRQIWLQQCLALPQPRYLHVPVLNDAKSGEKLSKQHGARPLSREPAARRAALQEAARFLGLDDDAVRHAPDDAAFMSAAIHAWRQRHV